MSSPESHSSSIPSENLYTYLEITLHPFVGNVPAYWPEFSSLQNHRMEEGQRENESFVSELLLGVFGGWFIF
jgi:hypothetical protein